MSDSEARSLYIGGVEAKRRFDYFFVGLILAVLGYILTNIDDYLLGSFWPVGLLGIVSLLGSFLFGMRSIHFETDSQIAFGHHVNQAENAAFFRSISRN